MIDTGLLAEALERNTWMGSALTELLRQVTGVGDKVI